MSQHVELACDTPGGTGTSVVLVGTGSVSGVNGLGRDFKLVDVERAFQMTRTVDSVSARPTGMTQQTRTIPLPLILQGVGASSLLKQQSVLSVLEQLYRVCDEISRFGGTLYYRPTLAVPTMRFEVATARVSGAHGVELEEIALSKPQLILEMTPPGSYGSLEFVDGFDYDTRGTAGRFNRGGSDWTADAGALSDLSVAGGVMVPIANLLTAKVLRHTGQPTLTADQGAELKINTGSSGMPAEVGVVVKAIDASNRIEAIASSGALELFKVIAGVRTSLGAVAVGSMTGANTSYWIDATIADNTITAYVYSSRPAINRSATPLGTKVATLSGSDATLLGAGVPGSVGIRYWPGSGFVGGSVDDFRRIPHEYATNGSCEIPLGGSGSWGGTTDARFAVTVSVLGAANTWAWAMLAWWRTPAAWNLVGNGNFEGVAGVTGWNVAVVTGIVNAATSVLPTTTAGKVRSGTTAAEVICPATSGTGANYLIARRFRAGVTYTLSMWVRASAGTTTVQASLGVNGDVQRSTATALSATWFQHSVTWTPTATVEAAYVSVGITAATATTFQIDDVMVYEGTTAPTYTPGGVGFGIANAVQSVNRGSAWSIGTDTSSFSRSTFLLTSTGACATSTHLADFHVLPHLMAPDDFAGGEVDVAVYAKIAPSNAQTGLTSYLSVLPSSSTYGPTRWADTGSAGKALTLPSSWVWRTYYVGTVTFRVDKARPTRERLRIAFASTGSGQMYFDHLLLVPAKQHAASMSGVAQDSSFDNFIPSTATTQVARRVDWDLSGTVREDVAQTGLADSMDAVSRMPRIGGQARLLAPRDTRGVTLLFAQSDNVVDRADSAATGNGEGRAFTLRVSPEPMHDLIASGS